MSFFFLPVSSVGIPPSLTSNKRRQSLNKRMSLWQITSDTVYTLAQTSQITSSWEAGFFRSMPWILGQQQSSTASNTLATTKPQSEQRLIRGLQTQSQQIQ